MSSARSTPSHSSWAFLSAFSEHLTMAIFSPVALIRPLLRRTDGAKNIQMVKTIWPSQYVTSEVSCVSLKMRNEKYWGISDFLTLYSNYITILVNNYI